MYVLGINSLYHESAACLLHEGRLVAAAEEERFNRVKHAKKPRPDNPDELPLLAMQYCLEAANITLKDVAWLGYSSDPSWFAKLAPGTLPGWMSQFHSHIRRVPEKLRVMGFPGEFAWVDHHTAHAASAFYASPFEEAAVLSIDGIGDANTTASFRGADGRLNLVCDVRWPHSLGFLWELVSMFLGFDIYDATKIMGLAAYGDPARFAGQFKRLIRLCPDGKFQTDADLLRFWLLDYATPWGYFDGLEALFGVKRRLPGDELQQTYRDIAAALQEITDELISHLAAHLYRETGSKNLCLAGGVALNCTTNQRVFEQSPFTGLFVQPAAHDAGTAIGSALYIWHHILGMPRRDWMKHAYLGPSFSDSRIERALKQCALAYEHSEAIESDVARLLTAGHIISFFQDRMEVGPRALGNRSLLADPRDPNMREVLNRKIKHREDFRPFAPSVLDEEAERWFHIGKRTPASDFMLMAYPVREHLRDKIPAVLHVDGTSRIQTVRRDANPRYHRLLVEFQKLTGVPVILNTSFNDSEPIVCTPHDAIDTFMATEIDYLAIGDFLVSKTANRGVSWTSIPAADRVLDRVFPAIHKAVGAALRRKQLHEVGGFYVVTDRDDCAAADRVAPLFPEHHFFLDQLDPKKIQGAHVLDIRAGSGVLSIGAVRAGAERATALEDNPKARALAGFNVVLNGCEGRIEITDGVENFPQRAAGKPFDYVISDPPCVPSPLGGDSLSPWRAEQYGLGVVEQIFQGLDNCLSSRGRAQIVAIAPGNKEGPFLLVELAKRTLSGNTLIRVNPAAAAFDAVPAWLDRTGASGEAVALRRLAERDGVSHVYLCIVHCDKSGPTAVTVEPATTSYPNWHLPLPAASF